MSAETPEESDCATRLRRGNSDPRHVLSEPPIWTRGPVAGTACLGLTLEAHELSGGWTEESKPRGLYGAHTRTLEDPERQVCLRRRGSLEGTCIFPWFFFRNSRCIRRWWWHVCLGHRWLVLLQERWRGAGGFAVGGCVLRPSYVFLGGSLSALYSGLDPRHLQSQMRRTSFVWEVAKLFFFWLQPRWFLSLYFRVQFRVEATRLRSVRLPVHQPLPVFEVSFLALVWLIVLDGSVTSISHSLDQLRRYQTLSARSRGMARLTS